MKFANFPNAVQRYPLSPPLSPSETEDADRAKMHQQQSQNLTLHNPTLQNPPSVLLQQHQPHQENGGAYGSRSAWCSGGEAAAFKGGINWRSAGKAYGYGFEHQPNPAVYYGYHGGWADWQGQQQEWDSSYPPPRPQPRPGQCRQLHPATPPREGSAGSKGDRYGYGYANPLIHHSGEAYQEICLLTQNASCPAPRQSAADEKDSWQGNSEDYAAPTTRSQTGSLKKPIPKQQKTAPRSQLQCVEGIRTINGARVNKQARYREGDSPEAIVAGTTVRVRTGPCINLTGLVTRATQNGADVKMESKSKTMNFSKKILDLVDPSSVASRDDLPMEGHGQQAPVSCQQPVYPNSGLVAPSPLQYALLACPSKQSSPPHAFDTTALPARHPQGASSMPAQRASPLPSSPPGPGRRSGQPKVFAVPRPIPTHAYMMTAHQPPVYSSVSCPLLVILDLNGTLLFRKNKGSNFQPRPHLDEFLEYLFSEHVVMVWSSAKPYNVISMCQKFFTPEQFKSVAAIWTRDNLRLSPEAYTSNTQVYKQLSWVWSDPSIQAKMPVFNCHWDQSNTILLDDSVEKSASEPFNLLKIEEYEARPDQANEDVLPQVAIYLDTLRSQRDVSAYMRTQPFTHARSMPRAAAEAIQAAQGGFA